MRSTPQVHERVADAVREAAIRTGIAHLERAPVGLSTITQPP